MDRAPTLFPFLSGDMHGTTGRTVPGEQNATFLEKLADRSLTVGRGV